MKSNIFAALILSVFLFGLSGTAKADSDFQDYSNLDAAEHDVFTGVIGTTLGGSALLGRALAEGKSPLFSVPLYEASTLPHALTTGEIDQIVQRAASGKMGNVSGPGTLLFKSGGASLALPLKSLGEEEVRTALRKAAKREGGSWMDTLHFRSASKTALLRTGEGVSAAFLTLGMLRLLHGVGLAAKDPGHFSEPQAYDRPTGKRYFRWMWTDADLFAPPLKQSSESGSGQ